MSVKRLIQLEYIDSGLMSWVRWHGLMQLWNTHKRFEIDSDNMNNLLKKLIRRLIVSVNLDSGLHEELGPHIFYIWWNYYCSLPSCAVFTFPYYFIDNFLGQGRKTLRSYLIPLSSHANKDCQTHNKLFRGSGETFLIMICTHLSKPGICLAEPLWLVRLKLKTSLLNYRF